MWISGILITATSIGFLYTGTYGYLVLLAMANGLSFAFFPIIMTIPFELPGIKPREIAVANSFVETFFVIGAMIGPVLAGGLQELTGDLRVALTVTCFFALSLTAGGILLPSKWDRSAVERAAVSP
ncbi:MAG: hypothetical protein ACE5JL_12585 [Dehalococcoidia bacterium]